MNAIDLLDSMVKSVQIITVLLEMKVVTVPVDFENTNVNAVQTTMATVWSALILMNFTLASTTVIITQPVSILQVLVHAKTLPDGFVPMMEPVSTKINVKLEPTNVLNTPCWWVTIIVPAHQDSNSWTEVAQMSINVSEAITCVTFLLNIVAIFLALTPCDCDNGYFRNQYGRCVSLNECCGGDYCLHLRCSDTNLGYIKLIDGKVIPRTVATLQLLFLYILGFF